MLKLIMLIYLYHSLIEYRNCLQNDDFIYLYEIIVYSEQVQKYKTFKKTIDVNICDAYNLMSFVNVKLLKDENT